MGNLNRAVAGAKNGSKGVMWLPLRRFQDTAINLDQKSNGKFHAGAAGVIWPTTNANSEVVRLPLQAEAEFGSWVNDGGMIALHPTSISRDEATVRSLVKKRADVQCVRANGGATFLLAILM